MSSDYGDPRPEIRATKLEAARRELDSGIRLFFAKEDALAIHIIAFAAYGLLSDLSKAAGRTKTLRLLEEDASLREGKQFWEDLKQLANFLKHADRDPDSAIEGIPEECNEAILFVGCFLLRELDQLSSPETQAMWLWHHAIYFININDAPQVYWTWIDDTHPQLHAESRGEKIEIGAKLLRMLRDDNGKVFKMEPEQAFLPWRLVTRPTIGSR